MAKFWSNFNRYYNRCSVRGNNFSYLTLALASEYEMISVIKWHTYLITIIMIVGLSLLVSFMVSRKNKTIDMVEVLKYDD